VPPAGRVLRKLMAHVAHVASSLHLLLYLICICICSSLSFPANAFTAARSTSVFVLLYQ
jgi:hypothetical protein